MDDIDSLILIGVLIALTAFFVASEFAIVRVRRSRIDQLITEGNKRAILAKRVITDLDEYLSASQLGITLTSIGLGVLGSRHLNGCCIHCLNRSVCRNRFLMRFHLRSHMA